MTQNRKPPKNANDSRPLNLVLGLGEIGQPLLQVLSKAHRCVGIDIDPVTIEEKVEVMHVAYPSQLEDFVQTTKDYADVYQPSLIVIHSTVQVGTTRKIAEATGCPCVNSPVRGKHARMVDDLGRYKKFIGGIDAHSTRLAKDHFEAAGFQCTSLSSPEATELAKLTETTYFGVLIAWAQEVDRLAQETGVSYDEVASIYEEIDYLPPVKFFPGIIGGHCVMPNIKILKQRYSSDLLDAIETSNERRMAREQTPMAPNPSRSSTQKSSSSREELRQQNNVTKGTGVIVRDFTNLYGCEIGDESQIGPFVEIQKGARIGQRCKVSSHTFICEGVQIEDEVFIGHGVTFTNDLYPHATNADGQLQSGEDWECLETKVHTKVSIGSGATILPGITIGEGAMIGAGSVVTRDVPAHSVVAGCPARVIRSVKQADPSLEASAC